MLYKFNEFAKLIESGESFIYARANGNTQRDGLERQVASLEDYVRRNFPEANYVVVKDITSGLKENRRG